MQIKPIVVLLPFLVGGITYPGIIVNKNIALLTTSTIGPYKKYDKVPITANVKNNAKTQNQYNLILYGESTSFAKRMFWASQLINYKPEETKTFNFAINIPPTDNFGLEYTFCVKNRNNDVINSWSFTIHENEPLDINLNESDTQYIHTSNFAGEVVENNIHKKYEIFDFSFLRNDFESQNYDKLPLGGIYMEYVGEKPFICEKVTLSFVDEANLFPNLYPLPNDKLKVIPFKYTIDKTFVYFGLKDHLYVNKKTLDMSSSFKMGYTLSRSIFLPLNHERDIADYTFRLDIYGAGITKSHFYKTFKYINLKKLIGDCFNSDFCIVCNRENG